MVEVRNEDNYEHLQYYVSAFVNAARSIQQYTYEDARKLGKLKEYDLLVAGNKVFKFFKNIRDDNIHKKPVETNRIGSSSMIGSLFVKTSETTEDQIAEYQREVKEKQMEGVINEIHYYFKEWDGPEDVFTLAQKYLDELDDFISEAERRGIIL